MTEVSTNVTMVIILQNINASNQCAVHLKLTQCGMSIISLFIKCDLWTQNDLYMTLESITS